jgi:hypothetical protein
MAIDLQLVKTRRVYYISGFDPRGMRHYHRLYREEAIKEAARRGYKISVGAKAPLPDNNVGWAVESCWPDGQAVRTDYCFMVWDDIVRSNWERKLWPLLVQCLLGYGRYFSTGVLARIGHSRRDTFFSFLLPILFLTLWGLALLVALFFWIAFCAFLLPNWLIGIMGAAALSYAILRLGQQLGEKLGVFWLMRSILFVEKWGSVGNQALEGRIDRFAARLMKDQSEYPVDEVLLVGHCVGSVVATAVASRYLKESTSDDRLTLITLGQCIPLLAFVPTAEAYRNEVATLASDSRAEWLDISAKADPLCFFDENPALICNSPENAPGIARIFHARIFRMFTPETYKQIRKNKLRLHFQYLMSAELETGYDYFQLTAGPTPAATLLEQ